MTNYVNRVWTMKLINYQDGGFYNADCFDAMRLLPDGCVDMILCDLPYGTTQNKWDSVLPLDTLWKEYWRLIKPNGAVVLTAAQPFTSALVMSQPQFFKYDLTWDKSQITGFLNAKKMPLRRHEDVLFFYKALPTYNPQFTEGKAYSITRKHSTENYGSQRENVTENEGRRYPTSILAIPQSRDNVIHPTQKPVALFEYLIKTYTNPGEIVLDNTAGSGTTAVAARNTGRRWICIERDETYFAAANARLV